MGSVQMKNVSRPIFIENATQPHALDDFNDLGTERDTIEKVA